MGFSLILRAFFSFPNERQFIECQFFWEFRLIQLYPTHIKKSTRVRQYYYKVERKKAAYS